MKPNLSHDLKSAQDRLIQHSVYQKLHDLESLKIFMQFHVFAVWDFMSLLKSLQQKITCVSVPWYPSNYPGRMVRLINEIVLAEESDLNHQGEYQSHFQLYLQAMKEIGADVSLMEQFLLKKISLEDLPTEIKNFIHTTLFIAEKGDVEEVAASFFYGREKLIPEMFTVILNHLKAESHRYPALIHYLERHIEVDQGEHGPMIKECLEMLCGDDLNKWKKVMTVAETSLQRRYELWSCASLAIDEAKTVMVKNS